MDQQKEKIDDFMQEELMNSFLLPKDQDEDEDEKIKEYLDSLPPGYRFRPTDEELVTHYLKRKLLDMPLPPNKIKEVNIYMYSPTQIFDKYNDDQEEGIMYFFTSRDRKYPKGNRPNRITADGDGYWKANGRAENIIGREAVTIGYKRSLVYYLGSSKSSIKTDWLMNEFTLDHSSTPSTSRNSHDKKLDKWVLCKIYNKNKNDEEDEENEVDYKAAIVEIHEPQRMQGVNCSALGPICHASSFQMPGYHSHTMCSGSSSQMQRIDNNKQISMPQYSSQLMQIPEDYYMSAQLPPTMLTASSSRMSIFNNKFPMPQEPLQRMQLNQLPVIHSHKMCGTSTSQTSVYHHNRQNNFSSSSQTPVYYHNGQNNFPISIDHLVPNNNRGYEIPPWIPNPPEQSNGMDYLINVPSEQTGWCGFTVLNQEELEPLDYKGSDNMKPGDI